MVPLCPSPVTWVTVRSETSPRWGQACPTSAASGCSKLSSPGTHSLALKGWEQLQAVATGLGENYLKQTNQTKVKIKRKD